MPVSRKSRSTLSVRLRVLDNCEVLKLRTPRVLASPDPVWKHVWNLECETVTKGLLFELRKEPGGGFLSKLKSSQILGRVEVPWATLLASPTLALDQFFPLSLPTAAADGKPPALRLSVSVTPPTQCPFLLRTEPLGKSTDDLADEVLIGRHPQSGPQTGRWLSRTVVDHAGKEVTPCGSGITRDATRDIHVNEHVLW